mmetsp:Transcript_110875/g.220522  ORF Transcript_110875/g.220522 Transcript_110875/m.220522 type:complete len:162 (-) Transcript_110875:50-535(-)
MSSKAEDKAAADAFSDRMNATPAKCSEADRFREADNQLKALQPEHVLALGDCPGRELPPGVVAAMESWCLLHDETPPSIEGCAKLAADPGDFRLVGLSTLRYLDKETIEAITGRVAGLDVATVRSSLPVAAEVIAVMVEWLQAALALHGWAQEQQRQADGS